MKMIATARIGQAAARVGENAPMAATCCNAWTERSCPELIGRLVAEGVCDAVHVTGPHPYLPKSDEMADVGVVLCVLPQPRIKRVAP